MKDQDKKYLSDILQSIQLIESFTSDIEDYDSYFADLKTQSAVERQLGILGEAVNKYDKLNPESTLKNTRQIIGFRNRLIHTYDTIDQSIVWVIIKNHLNPLKKEIVSRLT
jgi:uncharacterized protein with HEPN domain